MADTRSPARCASRTGGKVGGFSLSPLKTVVAKPVQSWWRPFPLPQWAELCGAFWVSCKEFGAQSSVTVSQNPVLQVRIP